MNNDSETYKLDNKVIQRNYPKTNNENILEFVFDKV